MKRFIALLLAFTMCFGLTAFAAAEGNTPETEDESDADWEAIEALGKVKTENGRVLVSITLPKEYCEGVTQEKLDASAGETFVAAKLNDDGSVTFKYTKGQHRELCKSIGEIIDEALEEMITDDMYTFTEITHNEDYSVFDVQVNSDRLGFLDSFATLAFYTYGAMYGIYSGAEENVILVNFYDCNGNLINTASSADIAE